ncbi:histidine--tRNA ligase [Syntrophomonas wolfei]|uniref:histidine--tRNA ligase n=1 Tax=Syntrophomonas wolfei TaxID=863 RepID=UPI000774C84A|nr:histidine--tRNA ligase [Syntrophomonas wolfei]
MAEQLRNPRGTRDYYGKEQQLRQYIRQTLEKVFAEYVFEEAETPVLNYYETLAQKYAGGAEILKEVYRLSDQGGRKLALRYDLTVPFARLVGTNPQLSSFYRRYEIGKVFRDGPVKTGRLREFTQCDVDMVGVNSILAEAELMAMAVDIFQRLDLDVVISYNHRQLLENILKGAGIRADRYSEVILSLDKLDKIGQIAVAKELNQKGFAYPLIENIFARLNQVVLDSKEEIVGSEELQELQNYLKALGIEEKTQFNPGLARGLDIYTGTVFEVFLENSSITSSIASGGRYDRIIGKFLGDGAEYPAVGMSFGLDVIFQALLEQGTAGQTNIDVFIIPLDTGVEALKLAQALRKKRVRVLVEMKERRLKKSLDYANKSLIPFVIVLGSQEVETGIISLKNMLSGADVTISIQELTSNPQAFLEPTI